MHYVHAQTKTDTYSIEDKHAYTYTGTGVTKMHLRIITTLRQHYIGWCYALFFILYVTFFVFALFLMYSPSLLPPPASSPPFPSLPSYHFLFYLISFPTPLSFSPSIRFLPTQTSSFSFSIISCSFPFFLPFYNLRLLLNIIPPLTHRRQERLRVLICELIIAIK